MATFIRGLQNATNYSRTENGALGFHTTFNPILDMNFKVSSYRQATPATIINDFNQCYNFNNLEALLFLFYIRDARKGVGERRLFRICFEWLANEHVEDVLRLLPLVAEYGRYDDVFTLFTTNAKEAALEYLISVFRADCEAYRAEKTISLLAKWMPTQDSRSAEGKKAYQIILSKLGWSPKLYRQTISALRKYANVVEVKMSAKQWGDIDYQAVPSKCSMNMRNAFLRNDTERRKAYLDALEKGEVKINASTLFPHEIVSAYCNGCYSLKSKDVTLEGQWEALPNLVNGDETSLVVRDGSGSMTGTIPGTKQSFSDVATALAIYFAERASGPYKDKFITFSEKPKLVDLANCGSLRDKISLAMRENEIANTNVERVFDLILNVAIQNRLSQEDIPSNIIIISDMEFDHCATSGSGYNKSNLPKRLFETIAERFAEHGYQLPRLIFWNVNSRTKTIPVIENDLGVALVSGYSVNIVKMVLSGKLDPYEALKEQLYSERYIPVQKALLGE